MSIGSGIAGQVAVAEETVYGTRVAESRAFEIDPSGESLDKVKNTVQGGGLAGGQYGRLGSRRTVTSTAGTGSLPLEVTNKGFGIWLKHLMGDSLTPVQQAATAAYLQTHALGDNVGKSLSVQKGIPDAGGVVRPYDFLGLKLLSGEFACALDQNLMATFETDAQAVSEASGLVTASYVAGVAPFPFLTMGLKLGTFGSEAAVTGVRGVTVKIDRPQAIDRFYAGAGGIKAEPLVNDWPTVTGTIDTDFVDKTIFADRYAADGSTSMVLEFIGPLIASTYFQTFRIRVPMIFLNSGTPNVEGTDVVKASYDFEGQLDGTHPLATIEYMSTDTAV